MNVERIIELRNKGWEQWDIALDVGTNQSCISKILRKLNHKPTHKICRRCKELKSVELFSVKKPKPPLKPYIAPWCKSCVVANSAQWADRNKTRRQARARALYLADKERFNAASRAYYQRVKNDPSIKAKYAERHRAWVHKNRERAYELNTIYQMKKRKAIPAWADLTAIRDVYERARELTKLSGVLMTVDHIVPLQSDLVCGLHVSNNLQIIPAQSNSSKGNRVWPSMPEAA